MKILLIHTTYRFQGGEDSVVAAEKHLLEKNQHTVFLLSLENPSNTLQSLCLFFMTIFNPFSYLKVVKTIKQFQPDVIHVHNWHFVASPAVFIAARRQKIPVVYTLHNYRLLCPSGILFANGKLFLESLRQPLPWAAVKKRIYRNSLFQTFWLAFIVWFHKKAGTWQNIDRYIVLTAFSKELFPHSSFDIPAEKMAVKPNFT